jgi:acyl carrier protein
MRVVVSPFTDDDLPRIAQLVGKTNQFNLTTRRHSLPALREFAEDPQCVNLSFRLMDRFADHGLIAVALAFRRETALVLDTWLMSCRVIGRTLEATVLQEVCSAARPSLSARGRRSGSTISGRSQRSSIRTSRSSDTRRRCMPALEELERVFRDVFGNEELVLNDEMTAADVPGWDSLGHINLMFSLEEHFGVQFEGNQLAEFANIGELRAFLGAAG